MFGLRQKLRLVLIERFEIADAIQAMWISCVSVYFYYINIGESSIYCKCDGKRKLEESERSV